MKRCASQKNTVIAVEEFNGYINLFDPKSMLHVTNFMNNKIKIASYASNLVRVQLRKRFTVRNMKDIPGLVQSTE